MVGFKRRWCSTEGSCSASIRMRWEHRDELIPLMSANVQPIASLYFISTLNNLSSFSNDNSDEMMIGKVDDSPRNAYQRWEGSCFSSSTGGFWIYGKVRLGPVPSSSKYFLLFGSKASIHATVSRNLHTFARYNLPSKLPKYPLGWSLPLLYREHPLGTHHH